MHATSWPAARKAVATALETKQIGAPCAARIVVQTADHGVLEALAAEALVAAAEWLQAPPTDRPRMWAFGGVDAGHVAALVRFARGQIALVSVSTSAGPQRRETMLVGNHGVLSLEGDNAEERALVSRADQPENDSEQAKLMVNDLRQALAAAREAAATAGVGKLKPPAAPRKLDPPYGLLLVAGDYTHQPNYQSALLAGRRCRLIAVADEPNVDDRRRKLNRRLAERSGVPYLEDLAQAIQRDDVHVVSICAEPERRGKIILQAAAAAGAKHLYLDKPLAGSLGDARAIAAAVEKAPFVHHMFSLVHADFAQRVRDVVRSKSLGDLLAVHFDLHFAKGHTGAADLEKPRRESDQPTSFELPDSKRELTNIGVYPLVQLLWTLDRPVLRVAAATGNFFFAEHQKNGHEDYGQMLLELEGGAVASVSVGRTGWRSHPAGGLSRAYLVGSRQGLVIDAARPRIEAWSDAEQWSPPQRDPDDPMAMWQPLPGSSYAARPKQGWTIPAAAGLDVDAQYFLDCIEQGRPSDVPAGLAAAASEILFGAYRAAASGQVVALPVS
jgi:predicted dehydrogenase